MSLASIAPVSLQQHNRGVKGQSADTGTGCVTVSCVAESVIFF